jgi:hypothetical protein
LNSAALHFVLARRNPSITSPTTPLRERFTCQSQLACATVECVSACCSDRFQLEAPVLPCQRSVRLWIAPVFLSATAIAPAAVHAESDRERIERLEHQVEQSNRLIEQLNARLQQLEQAAAAHSADSIAPATAVPPESTNPPVQADADTAPSPEATSHGTPLHAFADVDHVDSGHSSQPTHGSGFTLGNLDFYLTPQIGPRIKSLFELNFEYDAQGQLGADVERAQIGYVASDALTVWVGRFHSPFGYWNTAFHHGAQLQTTVDRPQFLAFEDHGGILPVHTVGVWLSGDSRFGGGRVSYDVYAGNGDRIVDGALDFNAAGDDNGNTAIGFNLGYSFGDASNSLLIGLDALSEHVSAYRGTDPINRVRLTFGGGYVVYDGGDWDVIAEYYRFQNVDLNGNGATHHSWTGFIQVGYIFAGRITPYVRYEDAVLDPADPYFASLTFGTSYTRAIVGLRYDLNPRAALKLEGNRTHRPLGGEPYDDLLAQFAIRF